MAVAGGGTNVHSPPLSLALAAVAQSRHGWKFELREGVKPFMKKTAEQACMTTLWSDANSATAMDVVQKMSAQLKIPLAVTPSHLGTEHCFTVEGKKVKAIRHFARDPKTVLLIDWDPRTEEQNPDNTILVK